MKADKAAGETKVDMKSPNVDLPLWIRKSKEKLPVKVARHPMKKAQDMNGIVKRPGKLAKKAVRLPVEATRVAIANRLIL